MGLALAVVAAVLACAWVIIGMPAQAGVPTREVTVTDTATVTESTTQTDTATETATVTQSVTATQSLTANENESHRTSDHGRHKEENCLHGDAKAKTHEQTRDQRAPRCESATEQY
jgi:carbohydrate-binding DOMON domain-containing protein